MNSSEKLVGGFSFDVHIIGLAWFRLSYNIPVSSQTGILALFLSRKIRDLFQIAPQAEICVERSMFLIKTPLKHDNTRRRREFFTSRTMLFVLCVLFYHQDN